MPLTLEDYLRTELPPQTAELDQIVATATSVLSTFHLAFDTTQQWWPYRVDAGQSPHADSFSFSTNAMVLFALRAIFGDFATRTGVGFSTGTPGLLTQLLARFDPGLVSDPNASDIGVDARARMWQALDRDLRPKIDATEASLIAHITSHLADTGSISSSSTFGPDDPFTLCWILESSALATTPAILTHVANRIASAFADPDGFPIGNAPNAASSHALPLVRAVQVAMRLKQLDTSYAVDLSEITRWFSNRLNEHLAYASILDSSFDAPELLFSLEGLLLCEPHVAGLTRLVDRILAVVSEKQQHNPNLRPYRPILSDERGQALLPLTIEVFTSLLRIFERLSATTTLLVPYASVRPILGRYAQWLLGQCAHIDTPLGPISGWSSEHTNTRHCIHVWETSQVLAFLSHYRAWITSAIRRDLFGIGAFTIGDPKKKSYYPKLESACEASEPNVAISLYRSIWASYISPRLQGTSGAHFSLLLYGPPGTGKTSFAEFIAATLGWPLVTITPSDFIVRGDQLVEERAKAIFRALEELRDVVILFDELDRLLLDRDSSAYERQQDIFQFMTPSMLPKLRRLHQLETSIFIVATNYEERIDPAAKRSGRVDDPILVSPPDYAARRRFLEAQCGITPPNDLETAAAATALFTYTELNDAWRRAASKYPGQTDLALRDIAWTAPTHSREITLEAYASRFAAATGSEYAPALYNRTPAQEFLVLYNVATQTGMAVSAKAAAIRAQAISTLESQ